MRVRLTKREALDSCRASVGGVEQRCEVEMLEQEVDGLLLVRTDDAQRGVELRQCREVVV